jgi:uncharacterized membrane protein
MDAAPDQTEFDQSNRNVESIYRTPRGLLATLKDLRAIALIDGKITVFDSAADYRDFYSDRDAWPEVTDPVEKRAFIAAVRRPLDDMNARPVNVGRASKGDFKVGRVFERTPSVYLPNFLSFTFVTLIASLPLLVFTNPADSESAVPYANVSPALVVAGIFLWLVLRLFSQSILVYGAFQSMRGKPVSLFESLNVAVREFFPLIGVAIITVIGVMAGMIFIIPGLMLYTAWFVGIPVCMVERLGPLQCLQRSADLTRGHRWAVFGIVVLTNVGSSIVSKIIEVTFTAIGGGTVALIGFLIGNAIWEAFFAVFVVVTYYELRVAKEGIDIDQIASVFD